MRQRDFQGVREASGLLLSEVAEVAGMEPGQLLAIEQGRRVRWDRLAAVRDALFLLQQWHAENRAQHGGRCPCVGCSPPQEESQVAEAGGSRLGAPRATWTPCLRENYRPRRSIFAVWAPEGRA